MAISAEVVESRWNDAAMALAPLRAKFEAVLPHLDERSARLVLAGEARSLALGAEAALQVDRLAGLRGDPAGEFRTLRAGSTLLYINCPECARFVHKWPLFWARP